jgi:Ion transport protein
MKYFAGTFIHTWDDGLAPRANFDTLKEAYTSVFQILVGENFNQVVFSAILAIGWSSVIYFVTLVVTGKFLLLQMFLAVILGNFEEARDKVSLKQLTAKAVIERIMRKKKIKRYSILEQLKKDGTGNTQGVVIDRKNTQPTSSKRLPSLMLRHQLTLREAANRGYL